MNDFEGTGDQNQNFNNQVFNTTMDQGHKVGKISSKWWTNLGVNAEFLTPSFEVLTAFKSTPCPRDLSEVAARVPVSISNPNFGCHLVVRLIYTTISPVKDY